MVAVCKGLRYPEKQNRISLSTHLKISRLWWAWGALWVAALLLYWPTRHAGFYADFLGWKHRFDAGSWADWWHCFGYPGHHQVFHAFFYGFYRLAGLWGPAWYAWFTALHALDALLVGLVAYRLSHLLAGGRVRRWVPVAAALAFLWHPYQSEAVVWRACMHYLLVTAMLLAALYALLVFAERRSLATWAAAHGLFVAALFTLELAVAFPLVAAIFLSGLSAKGVLPWRRWLLAVTGVHAVLLSTWLLLNRLTLGQWVGHYGAEVHLKTDWQLIFGNLFRYLGKYMLFSRDWPWAAKEQFWQLWGRPEWVWLATGSGLLVLALFVWRFRKWRPEWQQAGLALMAFFAALAPVSNLYHAWMLHVENDRYGYFASAFFLIALMPLVAPLPRRVGLLLALSYLGATLWLAVPLMRWWQQAQQVYAGLIEDFRWHDEPQVFVLACPDNYRGIFVFKDYSKKSLMVRAAVTELSGRAVQGQVHQVAMFNMNAPEEGVTVQAAGADTLRVRLRQWGNWWWRNGIGASNYENEWYRFRKKGRSYVLEWKKRPQGAVFIYSDGLKWRTFEWPSDSLIHE